MRQVSRGPKPSILTTDLSDAHLKIRAGGDADGSIYRHEDIVLSLRRLYLDKCFLCECKIEGNRGQVEHFLPWHRDYPERAYEWDNLHWSCSDCNQRKRRKPYRHPSSPKEAAIRTALLNPCAPPHEYVVNDLLGFDPYDRMAVLKEIPSDSAKKENLYNTVSFLNDAIPLSQRQRRFTEFGFALFEAGCTEIWRKLSALLSVGTIDLTGLPSDERITYAEALRKADGIFEQFLCDSSPFFSCMTSAMYPVYKLTVLDFRRMSDLFRDTRGLDRLVPPLSTVNAPALGASLAALASEPAVREALAVPTADPASAIAPAPVPEHALDAV